MKGSPENVAEWQLIRNFIDTDGIMNDKFLAYIKSKILWRINFQIKQVLSRIVTSKSYVTVMNYHDCATLE